MRCVRERTDPSSGFRTFSVRPRVLETTCDETVAMAARTVGYLDYAVGRFLYEENVMGLLSFIKSAGEKLFGKGTASAAQADSANPVDRAAADAEAGKAITTYVRSLKLAPDDLAVTYAGATETVTVTGTAPDQATRERIVLAAGNVQGVTSVDDRMTVIKAAPEARFHTVVRGDTLSAIAKTYYGNANKYTAIFEANKPMLAHPDKIYPGQVLRIPEEA